MSEDVHPGVRELGIYALKQNAQTPGGRSQVTEGICAVVGLGIIGVRKDVRPLPLVPEPGAQVADAARCTALPVFVDSADRYRNVVVGGCLVLGRSEKVARCASNGVES